MNRRKTFETILNRWSVVAAGAAATCIYVPYNGHAPTEQDPTGGAGLFAPVVALCVAAMILTEAIKAGELQGPTNSEHLHRFGRHGQRISVDGRSK